jgi:hypothetical protein
MKTKTITPLTQTTGLRSTTLSSGATPTPPVYSRATGGHTPLDIATARDHEEVAGLLRSHRQPD